MRTTRLGGLHLGSCHHRSWSRSVVTLPTVFTSCSQIIQDRMRSPLHRWALALAVAMGLRAINGDQPQQAPGGRSSPLAFLVPSSVFAVPPGMIDSGGRMGVATTTAAVAAAAPISGRSRVVGRGRHRRRSRVLCLEARKNRVESEADEYR